MGEIETLLFQPNFSQVKRTGVPPISDPVREGSLGTDHWGQANVFIISCTHSISSTTPDQESTAIFPIQLIRVQSIPYRTWPVPKARLL